jgi:hypothetical protein
MNALAPEKTPGKLFISQQDNYSANFGEVLRSSAVFWAKNDTQLKTTVSLTNYWKYKNGTDVNTLINLRDASALLIERIKVEFTSAEVFNYSPPPGFHGSVEIEAFSIKNLRIPYAAVMAVYECADSITMVHSYSRAYSQHEIEDRRTICVGEESCWTLSETTATTSFCVLHNGPGRVAEQRVRLGIRRADGEEKVIHVQLPGLAPFQTVVIEPREHLPDIAAWLGGCRAMGESVSDWRQLLVTHSNFDYSLHETDRVQGVDATAYMLTPTILDEDVKQEIVVYPDSTPGAYAMKGDDFELHFKTAQIVRRQYASNSGVRLQFCREDGMLPSRIVTALRLGRDAATIAAECSLGVAHHKRPAKHFSWMLVSRRFDSIVCWVDLKDIYGGCPQGAKLVFKFYSPDAREPLIRETEFSQLPPAGAIRLEQLFDAQVKWPDSFGYLTVWCSYGGLEFFSTLAKKSSISIEHSF